MKKIVIVVIVLLVLGGVGFFGYKYFNSSKLTTVSNQGPSKSETLLCSVKNNSCTNYQKSANSGNVKITITQSGKPVANLEVDFAQKPGAQEYYMKQTDKSGIALLEGMPAGNYFIYFNQSNFPVSLGEPPTKTATIVSGETAEVSIKINE